MNKKYGGKILIKIEVDKLKNHRFFLNELVRFANIVQRHKFAS